MTLQAERCTRCNGSMDGMMIGSGSGWICERCFYLTHPFQGYTTFRAVLNSGDDRYEVTRLLERYVPADVKQQIREKYNEVMAMRYRMRCSQLGITDEDMAKENATNHEPIERD